MVYAGFGLQRYAYQIEESMKQIHWNWNEQYDITDVYDQPISLVLRELMTLPKTQYDVDQQKLIHGIIHRYQPFADMMLMELQPRICEDLCLDLKNLIKP